MSDDKILIYKFMKLFEIAFKCQYKIGVIVSLFPTEVNGFINNIII